MQCSALVKFLRGSQEDSSMGQFFHFTKYQGFPIWQMSYCQIERTFCRQLPLLRITSHYTRDLARTKMIHFKSRSIQLFIYSNLIARALKLQLTQKLHNCQSNNQFINSIQSAHFLIHFYQNCLYISYLAISYSKLKPIMFAGTFPSSSSPLPTSPDAHKIIDAIRDQTDGVPPHLVFVIDIVSVRFGGYFTPEIKAQLEKFTYLQMLTLNDCGIVSLQNFPHLPGLIRLDLVFNQITGDSLSSIRGSRHLQTLMLGANKIEKFEHLEQLNNLKQLLQLDLINNPVSKLAGYRQKMFAIFPTISILDTLDRSGKDAYSNSSMVQALSRVPDALFDKSPPPPVVFAPPPARTTTIAKTPSVSKPVTPIIKTSSRASIKSKADPKPGTDTKKGKAGKLGKTALASKNRSSSSRAGLVFPAGRLKRRLREVMPGTRITAVLEYLSAELLEGAVNIAVEEKKKRIMPSQIKKALKLDEQLFHLLKGVTFSMND